MNNCSFISQIDDASNQMGSVYENIFEQYERVVIQSLITSFGLDFLIQDRHGGDVDTIRNVRQIGKDEQMTYKNATNAQNYENRGAYDAADYHQGGNFQKIKHEAREQWRTDFKDIKDEYTGGSVGFYGHTKSVSPGKKAELDHVISAKEVHNDKGRVLAGIDGKTLADSEDNFAWTNKSLNASMQDKTIQEYIAEHPELDEKTKQNLLRADKKARAAYNQKINLAYYTSKGFWRDSGKAAVKLGISMGIRQALGLVFTEIWFTVKDTLATCKGDGKSLFKKIAAAVKKGLSNAKKKFKDIWEKFIEGAVAGILSSLVTTLANIFFTTAKNIVKIIRESWASLTQAFKILFINPDSYALGDRFVAVAKVLSTGASVIAGTMIHELIQKTPLGQIPVVGDIVSTFCSVLVTGIMSCSFLYLFDHNKAIRKAVEYLNKLPDIDNFAVSLKKQGTLLDRYLAELMKIDFDLLEAQQQAFSKAVLRLGTCKNPNETNKCLQLIYSELRMDLPWKGYESFDSFMSDKNSRLVFK